MKSRQLPAPVSRAKPESAGKIALPFGVAVPVTSMQKFGMFCFWGFMLSAAANDLAARLFGGRAYLSWFFGPLAIVAYLCSGAALRALQSKIGKLWLGVAVFMIASVPFSIFRSASLDELQGYLTKTLVIFFFCAAFVPNLAKCRTLFSLCVVVSSIILGNAALFGGLDTGGRFCIPGSLTLGNSNDFALTVVCNLGFVMYLIWQPKFVFRLLGFAEFLASIYFILKTGSRGGFLAFASCMLCWLLFAGAKRKTIIALMVPALAVLPFLSGDILSRLIAIEAPSDLSSGAKDAAQESQMQRTYLLGKSIEMALSNPLFGVGPGRFQDALYAGDVANSTHTASFNPHNSYAQIASECGLPALILYVGALFFSIRANLEMMKRTRNFPGAEPVYVMALCLLGNLAAYAVGSFFDHVVWGPMLPTLSGVTVALQLASRNGDPQWSEAELALGKT